MGGGVTIDEGCSAATRGEAELLQAATWPLHSQSGLSHSWLGPPCSWSGTACQKLIWEPPHNWLRPPRSWLGLPQSWLGPPCSWLGTARWAAEPIRCLNVPANGWLMAIASMRKGAVASLQRALGGGCSQRCLNQRLFLKGLILCQESSVNKSFSISRASRFCFCLGPGLGPLRKLLCPSSLRLATPIFFLGGSIFQTSYDCGYKMIAYSGCTHL